MTLSHVRWPRSRTRLPRPPGVEWGAPQLGARQNAKRRGESPRRLVAREGLGPVHELVQNITPRNNRSAKAVLTSAFAGSAAFSPGW